MLQRLRPEALDQFGLAAALRELIEGWQHRHPEIACTFALESNLPGQGDEKAVTLYRSVQEALTNVARHSMATCVEIRVRQIVGENGDRLVLFVRDNGRGATSTQAERGFGLLGIRERVLALGGSLTIPDDTSHGFRLEVELPLAGKKAA